LLTRQGFLPGLHRRFRERARKAVVTIGAAAVLPPTGRQRNERGQARAEMLDDRRDLRLDAEEPGGDRLLPGEAPTSANADEAVHWVAVYAELVEFLRSEAQPFAPALTDRYQRRLAFWVRRLEELSA
jgi:hypothetical protein